ncbi:MAG: DUF3592 domain-containing protein [Alphaproteobacteria bacterium]
MIKQPLFFIISIALLLVIGWFVVDRIVFLQNAKRITGKVVSISAHNDRCGSRRTRYSCTRFDAKVQYTPPETGKNYIMNLGAGSVRGHNQPVSRSGYQIGSGVQVAYDARKPETSYEDTFFGIWGTPLMVFFFQITTFFSSLTEPRRRGVFYSS